ncbi:DUF4349 domain-containing protein [Streptomyces aidingensis]|uniref:DUF4349 domain-containing protein n=1 Tax=Streptomyces aidingensis TaxID=910347 RepID=A0A1I1IN59_9ACTN|nr:DUF4349 domain-containing protein [Streptomyces aidingensis]SFC37152.1 protein of unknown function [Streptomyces aidingensis]
MSRTTDRETTGRHPRRARDRGRRRRRGALPGALLLAALLALTACSGTDGADGSGAAADRAAAAPEEGTGGGLADEGRAAAPEEAEAAGEPGAGADGAGEAGRDDAAGGFAGAPELPSTLHLIRTAHLSVLTEDVPGSYREAVRLAERAGGYVSEEQTDEDSAGYRRSRITLRVPPEEYGSLLQELAGLGRLAHREVTTEDVTREVVDVESRIASQEESVARVRALMEDATTLTDVVTLESELSRRQADLEALKAQQKSLSEQTGMATITLELREPEAEEIEPEEAEDAGPSLPDALRGGWDAFLTTLLWIAVVIGAALPFVVTVVVVVLFGRWLRKRLPARPRPGRAAPPPPPAAPAPAPVSGDGAPAAGADRD